MKYHHLLSAFHATPWAILPAKLEEMRAALLLRAGGGKVKRSEIEAVVGGRRDDGTQMAGRVAVVTVFGTISQRLGLMDESSGGVSCERLGARLDALAADQQVRAIVLAFDSPGGSVFGVQELGEKIRGLAKKCYGIADSMAASAAYWLAAQCKELWCTPGGQVGSIGVLAAHTDYSKMDEAVGVKTTLIHAGKYKVEGNPYEPLGDDARAELQSKVDAYYGTFVDAVAQGRGTKAARVRADMGQGRMMTAAQAKAAGMIDRIGTVAELLDKLGAGEVAGPRVEQAPALPAAALPAAAVAARARAVEVA